MVPLTSDQSLPGQFADFIGEGGTIDKEIVRQLLAVIGDVESIVVLAHALRG